MTMAASVSSPRSLRLRLLRNVQPFSAPRWAVRLWADLRIGLVTGLGMVVFYMPRAYAAAGDMPLPIFWTMLVNVASGWSMMGFMTALLNRAASHVLVSLWARWGAVMAASLLLRALAPLSLQQLGHDEHLFELSASPQALLFELSWTTVLYVTLITFYLDRASTRRAAAQRLAALRSEQQLARRGLVEARLRVLQARIDPQLFFEMLGAVRDRYASDPAAAETLLEHLTEYLRAALPRLREAMSTVAQEVALARAYNDLLNAARAPRMALAVQVDAAASGLPFPAGVLLPLLQALRSSSGDAPGAVELWATHGPQAVRLRLQGSPGGNEPMVERVRETLVAVYDAQAMLTSRPGLGGSWVIEVEVPGE